MIVPPWLKVALQELDSGVKEIPGDEHNPRIIEYHSATTMQATEDEVPWCASFVCWCLQQSGTYHTASASARSYLTWGFGFAIHPYGSIVILKRGDTGPGSEGHENIDAPGHVWFLVMETKEELFLLGGNQGDRVSIQSFERDRLLGCRWPG